MADYYESRRKRRGQNDERIKDDKIRKVREGKESKNDS